MNCAICKTGDVVLGEITVTLQRGATTVVIKAVPAGVCTSGEEYVDEQTTRRLADVAEIAARTGAEVEVRHFAAA